MNSENQQKIIAFLQEHKTASGRQLAEVLGRDSRSAWNILMHLLRREIITHCGTGVCRELKLAPNWERHICHRKTEPRRKPATPAITEVCRQNWRGYEVHQIFGSAKP
ncbi:hypothetical protein [Klebsiella sp. BIGb0407]|uniref:hypothetical protein n=1 Tax=Klebsiella sp. BIGb0407 TaxID=2940603 RepID=UPI002169FDE9|nr:hypothetical protein [Klebsiella sp. BIGb0407]MCS3430053.1 DNA-binding Lrp family transcriptional regulator [Klebsiella sp. BIGb0407]